jgi:ATP-binding cassette, subfamily B, multidrug efflux pump
MSTLDPSENGGRKLRAVVGSQISRDEEMFGAAFDRQVVRRFMGYVRPYQGAIVLAVIAVLTFTASQLAMPLIIRWAIDDALLSDARGPGLLVVTVAVFFAIVLTNYAANWLQDWLVGWTGERVIFELRRSMFAHLQNVALTFMDRTEVGRMMSRLQGDVNSLQEFLDNSITAIGDLVLLVGIVVIMLTLNFELGLLTLAIVPTLFLVRIVWLPRARAAFRHARETNSVVSGALAEGIRAVRTVQAMRREGVNYDLFDIKARDNLRAHLRAAKFGQTMVPIVDTLTGLALAIVIVLGGSLVLNEGMDIGVIVAFIFYVQRFFDPIRSLTMQYSIMQRAMASGQRIFEVLDVPLAISDKAGAAAPANVEGAVEFRNVTFGYEKDRPVLHDVSFQVQPGETVALVGPTGSGKTSITSLLHRFYEVWEGSILIDGIDVRDYAKDALSRHVSMVLQDPFLFTGTIFENIRYNKEGATRADVEDAAKVVGAHEFIMRLPMGYDTMLVELGRNLSLGQRQLLSFARALVADTRILILDEATANIDSYTERQIQKALERLLEGRTGIVIAHRLATIRGANRIVVLKDGQIVETGPHDALIEKNGLYASLYALNYASFDDMPAGLAQSAADNRSTT